MPLVTGPSGNVGKELVDELAALDELLVDSAWGRTERAWT